MNGPVAPRVRRPARKHELTQGRPARNDSDACPRACSDPAALGTAWRTRHRTPPGGPASRSEQASPGHHPGRPCACWCPHHVEDIDHGGGTGSRKRASESTAKSASRHRWLALRARVYRRPDAQRVPTLPRRPGHGGSPGPDPPPADRAHSRLAGTAAGPPVVRAANSGGGNRPHRLVEHWGGRGQTATDLEGSDQAHSSPPSSMTWL